MAGLRLRLGFVICIAADAIITFPPIYWEMLQHPGTDEWNQTFLGAWAEMEARGQLDGFLRTPAAAHVT